MAKCSNCGRRKAKRACPARGGELCPQCCGVLRDREIHCPPHCPHRERHKPYQDRRLVDRGTESGNPGGRPEDDILGDERLAWLALHANAPLAGIARSQPEFTDTEAVLAMEYAKEKLKKGGGLIVLPGEDRKPQNEAGEAVRRGLESCRFERSVLLVGNPEGYTTDEKVRVLDRLLLAARSFARRNPSGRTYLDRIMAQFAQMREDSAQRRVL